VAHLVILAADLILGVEDLTRHFLISQKANNIQNLTKILGSRTPKF
jgi:hypothetical protein